ncbi:MAG TPA: ABC transporter permease [Vicinamibacteria bacterium]|nr:ABC transporter permease [Vicinamibacteria bacterium]
MRALAVLAAKDIRLLLRDRWALLFLLLAPLVVISVAGFSLSTFYGDREQSENVFLLPVADRDGGGVAERLVSSLGAVAGLRVVRVDEPEARRLVAEAGEAGAALVIPQGFTTDFRAGREVRLVLLTDPVKYLELLRIKIEVARVQAALVASQVASRVAVVEVLTHAGDVDFESVSEDAGDLASRLVDESVGLDEQSLTSSRTSFNTFDQNVPGFGVTFLMLGMLLGVGLGLVDERDWGILYRLTASPVSAGTIVTGKVISRVLIGVVQMALLFAFGRALFGISLGPSLLALGLVVIGVSFASAAFGLLIASLAPTRDSVVQLGTIAIMAMAAIGGCWWPMSIEPGWLRNLAHLFPTAWAMEASNDLMLRERSLSDVGLAVIALVLFGLVYLAVGRRLYLRREEASP